MDRTVPQIGSEEIALYMRTYYSLLRSTDAIQIEALVETHKAMDSSLHIGAESPIPDVSALVYTSQRLPACIDDAEMIIVGQLMDVFERHGYGGVEQWERVAAPGRRRRMFFDGEDTLAVFIAGRSDIDDLIPMLTAYQIEWNKINRLFRGETPLVYDIPALASQLNLPVEEVLRLQRNWDDRFAPLLQHMAEHRKRFSLRLLATSLAHYRKATSRWWRHVTHEAVSAGTQPLDLEGRPVYFVSSNTHTLPNLLSGFALRESDEILKYIRENEHADLLAEYESIQERYSDNYRRQRAWTASRRRAKVKLGKQPAESPDNMADMPNAELDPAIQTNRENFFYYALRMYLANNTNDSREFAAEAEREIGLIRIPSQHGFDVEAQIIDLSQVRADWIDPRLGSAYDDVLKESDALILNIDYPLGLAAYELLSTISPELGDLLGAYVMGKAATLNGRIGDVMISNTVHDEFSSNTYLFHNCFSASHVAPYLVYGTVLDNQKALTARGTFLQNPQYMSVFYHEGYTVIEMEAGPYLSAIYEAFRPQRHPHNEIVNLYHPSRFEVGMLHYASDRPMSPAGQNLGAGSLSYRGMDATYACGVAIVRQIFKAEVERLSGE